MINIYRYQLPEKQPPGMWLTNNGTPSKTSSHSPNRPSRIVEALDNGVPND